jgi:hypothetical protein
MHKLKALSSENLKISLLIPVYFILILLALIPPYERNVSLIKCCGEILKEFSHST